ncbi:lytic transglycosylase domain-containing protein [Arthrobacter sp. Br18]|uniref:lytic transglycosylase domain-containing protein n=1 Tax=Arthrobacter sp. Br18 TaxID=1312954 RepID=UPI00047B236F|nr:lytic transglycosylase domain-containing protein [Arthrobacter sp. Br18]
MTVQRPPASPSGSSRHATARTTPRRLSLAVSTAAIPAVILSSVALAQPATAAPSVPSSVVRAFSPATAIPAHTIVPAALVAVQVPVLNIPTVVVPESYTVRAGDTISAIAARHDLSTSDVLDLNAMDVRTIIYPGQKIKLTGSAAPDTPAADGEKPAPTAPQGSYTVRSGDTLGAIAARHGVSLTSVLSANKLVLSSVIHPGQKLVVGEAAAPEADANPTPASAPAPAAAYTVRSGDTLGAIAARHGISLSSILSANNLSRTSIIHPGQKLILGSSPVSVQSLPVQSVPGTAPAPAPAPAPADSYTIKAGDTLSAIAARSNVSLSELLKANNITAATVIHPGKTLRLPGATPGPTPGPAPVDLVPSSFLGVTYPAPVVADANANKQLLNSLPAPSQAEMRKIVFDTATAMGVDPSLALAFSFQESGFNQRAVSPANAIGAMQVIPSSGGWASDLVGRKLNLLDPYDNATAGVAIIRSLIRSSPSLDIAIASYYQGQYSVQSRGMFEDTKTYVAAIKAHQVNFK